MKHCQVILTSLPQFIIFLGLAQPLPLEVNSNIILPKDSIESRSLVSSLNNFLVLAQKPDGENNLIAENEKIETSILLDEIKGIEKSGKFANEHFYKPYLLNVVPLEGNSKYMIQVSLVGIDNSKTYQRALFTLFAHKSNRSFSFSSPLSANTKDWKKLKVGNNTFTNDSKINWCEVKEKPLYFKTGEFNNSADNVVSALLVKYIEKEKGFEGVWQLLNCGKQEAGNISFYQTLEKITGVTRSIQ